MVSQSSFSSLLVLRGRKSNQSAAKLFKPWFKFTLEIV